MPIVQDTEATFPLINSSKWSQKKTDNKPQMYTSAVSLFFSLFLILGTSQLLTAIRVLR